MTADAIICLIRLLDKKVAVCYVDSFGRPFPIREVGTVLFDGHEEIFAQLVTETGVWLRLVDVSNIRIVVHKGEHSRPFHKSKTIIALIKELYSDGITAAEVT